MNGWQPVPLLSLVGQRLLQRGRRFSDEHGGYARAGRVEQERVERALQAFDSFPQWLSRPESGRLWLSSAAAPRWARVSCGPEDLGWAEEVVAGRYSLLGAERVNLGNPPVWNRDLYTGRDWPLEPSSRLPLSRGDGSDIRTVWELSRCYHFVALAKAYWRSRESRFLRAFHDQVLSWLDQNPVGRGANWRSPMDVAIRAANWSLAAVLFASADQLPQGFWISLLANLRVSARFVARHLEWHPVYRGNHYVSNGVGLVYVGALFRDDPDGARWLRTGARILRDEIEYQVGSDGVSGESAIGYHRLVTEFFTYGGEICKLNLPGFLPGSYWQRLRSMYRFLATYLDSQGQAPLLGDADDGRLHHLCARSALTPREHAIGLRRRYWPAHPTSVASSAFPVGGFYILRSTRGRCIVRCGPVGLHGAGSHDHNDQLSYELSLEGTAVISDSGTFAYTRDLSERYAFRATAAHNAIQLDGGEQNSIRPDRPWRVLGDRTRAQCTEWSVAPHQVRFGGRHFGFSHLASGAVCARSISLEPASDDWTIRDRLEGQGRESLTWRTHFAPGELRLGDRGPSGWSVEHAALAGYTLSLEASALLRLEVKESRLSERYGTWVSRPMLQLSGEVELPVEITLTIRRA